jgi:hypothetical protein
MNLFFSIAFSQFFGLESIYFTKVCKNRIKDKEKYENELET